MKRPPKNKAKQAVKDCVIVDLVGTLRRDPSEERGLPEARKYRGRVQMHLVQEHKQCNHQQQGVCVCATSSGRR